MIKGIHHVTLVVRDLAAAQSYYGAVAGMHRLEAADAAAIAVIDQQFIEPEGPGFASSLLAGRNGYLLLIAPDWSQGSPEPDANPVNRAGIRHFCVQNHDCTLLEQAVSVGGGSLIAPPLDLGTGNQYAYARDGEGNIMEIEGLPYAPKGEPTWLAHVALVTRDIDRAIEFYAALLETGLKNRGKFGPGPQLDRMGGFVDARIEGAWLPAGNLQLELWQFHEPPSPAERSRPGPFDPGFSRLCLECDDLDVDAARLVALGGKLRGKSIESRRCRSILASDLEGNVIELLELRETGATLSIMALADPEICARVEAGR